MISKINRKADRKRRHIRVRRKISGTAECPRLAVCRTNKNIIAQIIDDTKGNTLVYVSTLDKDVKTKRAAAAYGLYSRRLFAYRYEKVLYDHS